jgi:eukaryotic-like serine/threonine-protein kinase
MSTAGRTIATTPKSQLLGMTLSAGWTLIERLDPSVGSSGGNFGVGYKATRGTETAFVKAIDFVDALRSSDPFGAIAALTQIALFERDVLEYCTSRKMSRVLQYFGHEYLWVGDQTNPLNRVSCLILEAGNSDLRRLITVNGLATCGWNLQVLRDVTHAVAQLHTGEIAHQDIKPSNVISFGELPSVSSSDMKVGDLGRVVRKGQLGPFDSLAWPGDARYSPPERWYGYVPPDWCDAREASDAYMLGSLLIYLFTGASLQALVMNYIPAAFRPDQWTGRYDVDLLPVLMSAHAQVLEDQLRPTLMPELADGIFEIARALAHPDPKVRGDKRARRQIGRPVGIYRIHQKLSAVALRCAAIDRGRRAP